MTGAQNQLRKLKEKHQMYLNLEEDITDLEMDLCGMEVEYEGCYAVVETVDIRDETAHLYVEEADGSSYYQMIGIDELEELI